MYVCTTHRHILQSYFFPNDYTERPPSHVPQPGERRVYASMDVTVRLSSKGSFNIPFNDEKDVGVWVCGCAVNVV